MKVQSDTVKPGDLIRRPLHGYVHAVYLVLNSRKRDKPMILGLFSQSGDNIGKIRRFKFSFEQYTGPCTPKDFLEKKDEYNLNPDIPVRYSLKLP